MFDLIDRKTLVASLPHGCKVAEIGVAGGEFSQVIFDRCQPQMLYLIDCWEQQPAEACGNDPSNAPDHAHQLLYEQVTQRFARAPHVVPIRNYSVKAAELFLSEYLDWVYIDANHLQVRQDIEAWWPKVRSGGWMLGNDYTVVGDYITVKTDVDKFVAERGLELFVTRGDTDIYEKNYPTWIFRKP